MSVRVYVSEDTTLGMLHDLLEQREVIALRLFPPIDHAARFAASLHHKTGFHVGYGQTPAVAVDAAFVVLHAHEENHP